MTNQYVPQRTLQYTTFVKRGIVEALQGAFKDHPDKTVKNARVALDFGHDRWRLPGVIIKFFERELPNAGVGHVEYLPWPDNPTPENPIYLKYYHRRYKGDISFDVYGQSAVDRDLVRDALIEVLAMTDTTVGGNIFINRFYWSLQDTPYGLWHYPVLNLDLITGYGEQAVIAPWMPEDMLVYQASYRVPIIGEFYSKTPDSNSGSGFVEQVHVYPYLDTDPTPEENPDPVFPNYPSHIAPLDPVLLPPVHGWYHFSGWYPTGGNFTSEVGPSGELTTLLMPDT